MLEAQEAQFYFFDRASVADLNNSLPNKNTIISIYLDKLGIKSI